jgi:hypothetical protein
MRWAEHVWGGGEAFTGFWWGNLREGDHWKTQMGGNIKMDLQCGGMDWMNLVQERDRWQALVNVVLNLPVSLTAGNFLTS